MRDWNGPDEEEKTEAGDGRAQERSKKKMGAWRLRGGRHWASGGHPFCGARRTALLVGRTLLTSLEEALAGVVTGGQGPWQSPTGAAVSVVVNSKPC